MIDTQEIPEQLTDQQKILLAALIETKSIAKAAKATGVPDKTARRWHALPAFQHALDLAQGAKKGQEIQASGEETAKNSEKPSELGEESSSQQEDTTFQTGTQQIAGKAALMAKEISDQAQAARASLERLLTERAALLTEQQQRANLLRQCEEAATTARVAVEQARSYAAIADGTLNEQRALADASHQQKLAEEAHAKLLKARDQIATQEQETSDRLAALDVQITREQAIIAQSGSRLAEVGEIERQALRQLGESQHAVFLEELAKHDAAIAIARDKLTDLQVQRLELLQKAERELVAWGDLVADVKLAMPAVNDATARVLRACVAYLDQILADRRILVTTLMESPETRQMTNWWRILTFGTDLFVNQPLNGLADHQLLQHRRDLVARVLADYERARR